jgi:hypothetical protein
MLNIDPLTILAFSVGIVALVLAIRRDRRRPAPPMNRENELVQRVSTLERDIASLQRMLVEKQNEIDRLNERIRQLERGQVAELSTPVAQGAPVARQVLLACIGNDPMLRLDLAHLRRVQAQTSLRLATLDPVTLVDLENMLDRQRLNGTPIRYVHFGVHSDQRGLYLADGVATWEWLSERLDGVDVVVLAGCSNDRIADKLRVVDAVISVRAREIQNKDAGLFVEVFWLAIGNGDSAQKAFEQALERAPARVGEFVELHL